MTLSRTKAAAAAALAATAAAGAPATALGGGHVATVVLRHMGFSPRLLRIHRGTSVKFIWRDGRIPHTVTSSKFKSSPVKTTGSYVVHFSHAGRYSYRCKLHPGMTGTIVVS